MSDHELPKQVTAALLQTLVACFTLASLAGIASVLRSNKPLCLRLLIATALYSGLFGLVIGLLWYNYFEPTNLYFLVGVSGLAGLGGVSLIDVAVQLLTNGANIKIVLEDHTKED